jgi:hypothetical protein
MARGVSVRLAQHLPQKRGELSVAIEMIDGKVGLNLTHSPLFKPTSSMRQQRVNFACVRG